MEEWDMRKLIVTEFYTLDGMMSDPKDEMDWVMNSFNDEMGKYEGEVYDGADTLLLGRVTYKIFENYWPHAAENPATPPGDVEMSLKMNAMTKIVFSRTLAGTTWQNSRLLKEIDPKEIVAMKQRPGKNMLVAGSANIVQQFADLGLVDEYHLLLHPVVLGVGKPLFKNIKQRHNLQLLGSRNFGNGVLLLTYQPIKRP
jgi:dihydrofolate reductase